MHALGEPLLRLERVASTNSLVLRHPAYLEQPGLVVAARHQTGGRGRMERRWASVPGLQLQFSVVLHPPFPPEDFPLVALLAGLAVAQAVEAQTGLTPRLKWPNDVFLAGRKVCGILVEGASGDGHAPRLVVGIGLNCNGGPADFPDDVRDLLTTLAHESGAPVDDAALLTGLLTHLHSLLERLERGQKAALLTEWCTHALLAGQRVRLALRDGVAEGEPVGLTAEGYLRVRLDDGSERVQVSGDLEWLG